MKKVVCIIPARMASTRYPGKPIAKILNHPMIEHVYRRVQYAKNIDDIFIATCDKVIFDESKNFGCKAVMTADTHVRGTDRVAEAAQHIDADIIINVQGDEPLVDPESLDKAIQIMKDNQDLSCINLVSPIVDWDVFVSKNVVKTVKDRNDNVLYFSRQPIPTTSKDNFTKAIKQIGIYLFRKKFLLEFTSREQTPLEKSEGVDMMRILEYGYPIKTLMVKDMISVDTPEELFEMEKILIKDPLYRKIFYKAN